MDIPVAGHSKFPKLLTRLSYLPPPPMEPNWIGWPLNFLPQSLN